MQNRLFSVRCGNLAVKFRQLLDTLLRQRLQPFPASSQMRHDLLTHPWLPESLEMIGDTCRTGFVIGIGGEIVTDVVRHGHEAFDVHALAPAACSNRCG
jgi:hypothetical protein